ncbi:Polysaccharide lyase family 14 protein [Mycena sanguinolenta]|uniref:Polysaccharide lyase family 14 protein n=1 Tax=Mycena sanguinolenta TaxID=230812 RepID=A0A8H6ZF17_9AGAR|nr:Polysaccharide lyase family 14 protein [Mycena sanguinolenta]
MVLFRPAFIALSAASAVVADSLTPASLAAQFTLTTSTTLPFPTATASSDDTQSLLSSQWGLAKGRLQACLALSSPQHSDIDPEWRERPCAPRARLARCFKVLFLETDPLPKFNYTSAVTYPAGSFSGNTGGAQFINLWNNTGSSAFQSMLVSYEVAFDEDFDWVMGGKLPGLRGGTSQIGCSGGNESTGLDCFSTRIMWRPNGAGEAYAYIPTPNKLCSDKNVICNSDFGISLSRGSFTFLSGQWNHIALLVQLNNPVDVANGNVEVYFNNVQAFAQQNLQIRASDSVTAGGLYFSTFFGGSDSSWATPDTTHTYFRNFELYGSSNPSTLSGSKVNSGTLLSPALLPTILTALFLSISAL